MSSLDRDGSGGDGTEHPELRQTIVQPRGGRGEGGSGSGGSGSGAIGIGKGAENATAQCSPRDPEKREVDMTMETTTTGNKHASQPQPPRITNHHTPTRTPAFTEKEDGDEEGQQQHRHSHSRRSRCASSDTFYARPVVDVEQAERGGEEISHRHKSSYVWRVLVHPPHPYLPTRTLLIPTRTVLPNLHRALPQRVVRPLHTHHTPPTDPQLPPPKPQVLRLPPLLHHRHLAAPSAAKAAPSLSLQPTPPLPHHRRLQRRPSSPRPYPLAARRDPNRRRRSVHQLCLAVYRGAAGR